MLMNKTIPNTTIETPVWLREMETILEELNEGVVVLDDELRVIFANEALTRMGHFERGEIQGRTPDAIFPSEDLPDIKRQHESGLRYGRHRNADAQSFRESGSLKMKKVAPKNRLL